MSTIVQFPLVDFPFNYINISHMRLVHTILQSKMIFSFRVQSFEFNKIQNGIYFSCCWWLVTAHLFGKLGYLDGCVRRNLHKINSGTLHFIKIWTHFEAAEPIVLHLLGFVICNVCVHLFHYELSKVQEYGVDAGVRHVV